MPVQMQTDTRCVDFPFLATESLFEVIQRMVSGFSIGQLVGWHGCGCVKHPFHPSKALFGCGCQVPFTHRPLQMQFCLSKELALGMTSEVPREIYSEQRPFIVWLSKISFQQ